MYQYFVHLYECIAWILVTFHPSVDDEHLGFSTLADINNASVAQLQVFTCFLCRHVFISLPGEYLGIELLECGQLIYYHR